jgi:hypothetical protein
MRFIPQEKGKAAVYLVVILGALGVAAYLMYGRGGNSDPEAAAEQEAINEHAEKINATMKAPAPQPDLPVEKRPPRGAPNTTK